MKPSIAELVPAPDDVLAQAAYLELVLFQELSDLVAEAPRLEGKQAVGQAAGEALERNEAFLARLADAGVTDSATALRKAGAGIDRFVERVRGRDTAERLLTCFLVSGLLHDLYRELIGTFPAASRTKIEPLLEDAEEQEILRGVLAAMTEADPRTADRIAMWGRRIMGDCLVYERSVLGIAPGSTPSEEAAAAAEGLASILMANHSRRMNSLGLAA